MNVQEWSMWQVLTACGVCGLAGLCLFLAAWYFVGLFLDLRERRLQILSAKWRPK